MLNDIDINEIMRLLNNDKAMTILRSIETKEIPDELNFSKSTFYRLIGMLVKAGFIEENETELTFTSKGHAYYKTFEKFKDSIITLKKIFDFFPDHKIIFPDDFFVRLHELNEFEIVTSDVSNLFKPYKIFIEYLKNSKNIYCIVPIIIQDNPQILEIIKKANRLSIIATREVIEKAIHKYPVEEYKNLELYVIDFNPYIAFTVTDKFLSIGFFTLTGPMILQGT
jgi:predicted transcriptional regulator